MELILGFELWDQDFIWGRRRKTKRTRDIDQDLIPQVSRPRPRL